MLLLSWFTSCITVSFACSKAYSLYWAGDSELLNGSILVFKIAIMVAISKCLHAISSLTISRQHEFWNNHLSGIYWAKTWWIQASGQLQQMVGQIYPTELQLDKTNSSDTEALFLDLNLSISNGIVSSKIYDKQDVFNFEIVNFSFRDGDVPGSPSYGVYISQLVRFARVCSNVDESTTETLFLTAN